MAKSLRGDLLSGGWPGVGRTPHADGSIGAGGPGAGGAASGGEGAPDPRAPADAAQFKIDLVRAGLIEAGDRFLPARAVWEHFGVSSMSLYRWLADPEMNFPRPTYFGRFRYWRLSELVRWEAARPTSGAPFGAGKAAKKATQAGAEEARER